jgi:hypothetical protein
MFTTKLAREVYDNAMALSNTYDDTHDYDQGMRNTYSIVL